MRGFDWLAGALENPSTRALVVGALLLTSVVVAAFSGPEPAPTVHSGLFELGPAQGADIVGDGNPATGPDWAPAPGGGDGLFYGNGDVIDLYGGVAASFLMDDLAQKGPLDRTTFSGAGGSNKNNDLISMWHWDAGNVPAKDDLSNAYAYATLNPANGHLVLYTGFERLDPSGDSHIDIEFFQDDVALDEAVPCDDPGPDMTPCSFTGARTVGDVIVSMDFTVGGTLGSVTVREWMGPAVGYVLVGASNGEGCNPADTICGFNNGAPIDGGPWPNYDRHGNEIPTLPKNAFTEFGVDVSALEGETPCLATAMGKTRSSPSFTAELKDFAGPVAFNVCGAAIRIAPDGVNDVGDPHTFYVEVSQVLVGRTAPAPDGTIVTVTLTDQNGGDSQVLSDTCASPGTVGGVCSVTFVSDTAGLVVGHAAADVNISGQTFHVETDGEGRNSGDATKRYVDAFVTIGPPFDTNGVQETHTFTTRVYQDIGDGAGFVAAPDGTLVTVTLTPSDGAIVLPLGNTCDNPGTVGGACTTSFTSPTAGTVTGHASVTFSVEDVSITRETDGTGLNSGNAVKVFVAGSLSWRKVDNAFVLQRGATFQVCRTHNYNSNTGGFDDVPDVCGSVTDNAAPDADPADGKFRLTGLVLGRYTIRESVPPPGFVPDPDTVTVDLTRTSPDRSVAEPFVNNRPILKLTAFGYTNTPKGTPTSGIVSGTTEYTIRLKNFGNVSALLDLTFAVSVDDVGGGSIECSDSTGGTDCTLEVSDLLVAAGAEVTLTFTLEYTDLPDGALATATLTATYTTGLDDFARMPSGAPASIVFTIQGD